MASEPIDSEGRLVAYFTIVACPGCGMTLHHALDRRTGVLNPRRLECMNQGCTQHLKMWNAPTVALTPAV